MTTVETLEKEAASLNELQVADLLRPFLVHHAPIKQMKEPVTVPRPIFDMLYIRSRC